VGGLIAAAAAALGMVAYRSLRPSHPNIVLIVLDTQRADRLGTYGHTGGLTPFLDRLAGESLVYERAYAPSSWTMPSVVSLFIAQYPSEHQVVVANALLPDYHVTLAEVLQQHGYLSAGFSANILITEEGGFAQGFDAFRLVFRPPKDDATRVNRAVFEWLDSVAGRREPLFLYLQYMEPHSPYRLHKGVTATTASPGIDDAALAERVNLGAFRLREGSPLPEAWEFEPGERQRLIQLYEGEIAHLDRTLGQLFGELDRRGILRHALVIVTSDHGEELGEHGMFGHGNTLYEESIRIPLLIRLPGERQSRRLDAPVSLTGLAPAILGHLGLSIPPGFRAAPLPFNGVPAEAYAYAEAIKEHPLYYRVHQRAVMSRTGKLLIGNQGEELFYDLATDPREAHLLPAPPFAGDARVALQRVTSQLVASAEPQAVPLDPETRERLRALGYAGGH
jgi:arylsulfatase A-like enzyme